MKQSIDYSYESAAVALALMRQGNADEAYALTKSLLTQEPHSITNVLIHMQACAAAGHDDQLLRHGRTFREHCNSLRGRPEEPQSARYCPISSALVIDAIARGSRSQYSDFLARSIYQAFGLRPSLLTRPNPDIVEECIFSNIARDVPMPNDVWFRSLNTREATSVVNFVQKTPEPVLICFPGLQEYSSEVLRQLSQLGCRQKHTFVFVAYALSDLTSEIVVNSLNKLAKQHDAVLVLTTTLVTRRIFSADNIVVAHIPESAPSSITKYRSETLANHPEAKTPTTFLAIGRHSQRKGLQDVAAAAALVRNTNLSGAHRIKIVGHLESSEYNSWLALLQDKTNVTILNKRLSDLEAARHYAEADFVLLPYTASFTASSGVLSCAAAFGKPVISTDHGFIGSEVARYQLGFVYPANQPAQLAERMIEAAAMLDEDYAALSSRCSDYSTRTNVSVAIASAATALRNTVLRSRASVPSRPTPPPTRDARDSTLATPDRTIARYPLHKELQRVAIIDTGIATANVGDLIIMASVNALLRPLFPMAIFFRIPSHEYMSYESSKLLSHCDHVFVSGTNLLSSSLDTLKQWKISAYELASLRNLILLGCGWWQYQDAPNNYSTLALRSILHRTAIHSLRDAYTLSKMLTLGLSAVNTACPTMWSLSAQHCARIPTRKARYVVSTLTDYNQNRRDDSLLLNSLSCNYERVYIWLQGSNDYIYLESLLKNSPNNIELIAPTLEAYDAFLKACDNVEYIGTRLHAGIRALQKSKRTMIAAVDNRAIEIANDTNLPVIPREALSEQLDSIINQPRDTRIDLPNEHIERWKGQFQ